MQGLPADERLHVYPQPLDLPMPGPGESCHDDYTECRLMPGGSPADHPASHWGKASQAGAHQVGHTQDERCEVALTGFIGFTGFTRVFEAALLQWGCWYGSA